jgi:hypothetical protein
MSEIEKHFKHIDLILSKLNIYYKVINKIYQTHKTQSIGGSYRVSKDDKLNRYDKKYYKKYKSLIKSSAQSINYYKNQIQLQMVNQMKITNYYRNLIGVLKSQRDGLINHYRFLDSDFKNKKDKIGMLETMIVGLEKFVEGTHNIHLDIKNKFKFKDGTSVPESVINMQHGNIDINLTGGAMDFNIFSNRLTDDMVKFQNHINNIDGDKKFLEAKIESLHARMHEITTNTDNLLKINTDIEWMVNKLENEGNIDNNNYEVLYDKIKIMIEEAKTKGNISELTADYINKLNAYSEYLQSFIGASDKNIKRLSNFKKVDLDKREKYREKDMTGGEGVFEKLYRDNIKLQIKKLKDNFTFHNIEILNTQNILNRLDNHIMKDDNDLELYIQSVREYSFLLKKLDKILSEFKNIYTFIQYNFDKDLDEKKLIKIWNEYYKHKKTSFYLDILEYIIYFFDKTKSEKKIKVIESFKISKYIDITATATADYKLYININNECNTKEDISEYQEILEKTNIAFFHLTYCFETWAYNLMVFQHTNNTYDLYNNDIFEALQKNIKYKNDNSMKSLLHTPPFTQDGGGIIDITYNNRILDKIPITDEIFNFLLSMNVKNGSDKNTIISEAAAIQVKNTSLLITRMGELYTKLCAKLNINININDDEKIELQTDIKNINDFLSYIECIKTDPQFAGGAGSIVKPRLDPYKKKLQECIDNLKPVVLKINILIDILQQNQEGNINALLKLYGDINKEVENGINSYIKIIPMIFFTIEFPPSIYKDDPCKYKFDFDNKTELVKYSFIGNNKEQCKNLDFNETDYVPVKLNSHAAFFESNKSNSTNHLITDPIIGLAKLIKKESNNKSPSNLTINMMFALGASGTGKTTRYFGSSSGSEEDKKGIVPYIISESVKSGGNKTISYAYFVCYGRKHESDFDFDFDELLIFFNINEITNKNNDDNCKYIPYIMPKDSTNVSSITGYTDFYTKLVSKKLQNTEYTNLKGFINDGEKFISPVLSKEPNITFRDILKTKDEIWKTISENEITSLSDTFEMLINEQKKINTVLPTKNNIESSRGHTCVLVRITDDKKESEYFPLFDMAGTENTNNVKKFFTDERNPAKMAKLVKKVNEITREHDIIYDNNKNGKENKYPSLNELLQYENINKYVSNIQAGGKEKITANNFYNTKINDATPDSNNDNDNDNATKFLEKIVNEGFYINHTIAMLIFAAKCVGSSLNTDKIDGVDNFDIFIKDTLNYINEYTCISSDLECKKTLMLLKDRQIESILNSSCIWLQVLFSFLYWNEENDESAKHLVDEYLINNDDKLLPYLNDDKILNTHIGCMTFREAIEFKDFNYKNLNTQIQELTTKMIEINKTNNNNIRKKNENHKDKDIVTDININNNSMKIIYMHEDTVTVKYIEYNNKNNNIKFEINYKHLNNKYVENKKETEHLNFIILENMKKSIDLVINTKVGPNLNIGIIKEFFSKNPDDKNNIVRGFKLLNDINFINYIRHTVNNNGGIDNTKNNKSGYNTMIDGIHLNLDSNTHKFELLQSDINYIIEQYNEYIKDDISSMLQIDNGKYKETVRLLNNCHLKLINNILTIDGKSITDLYTYIQKIKNLEHVNNNDKIINQMNRIRDARSTATKMTLMHLVTGQGIKHHMVKETIDLCDALFKSTELKLTI